MVQMNTIATVNLDAIRQNLMTVRSKIQPGVRIMAVIKDKAYGHGLVETAQALHKHTEWFCVARAEEGVALRKAGITNPVLVFEAVLEHTSAAYPEYDLTATLHEVEALGIMSPGTRFHINLDTGMHRLGIIPEDVERLKKALRSHTQVKAEGIYTHFFKSDDPSNPEVQQQLDMFNELRADFSEQLMTHTANTGALFHYPHYDLQFDAVRPGVCLYGYGAGDADIQEVVPALDLHSFLMQVKPIKKGETVSYGGRWAAPADGYIGIIPSGYSDGIQRNLSGKIELIIHEKRYPQVGTISMDYMIVFLGDDKPESGSKVYLLKGNEITAKDWARKAGTIPYEITTNIKEKVSREYSGTEADQ